MVGKELARSVAKAVVNCMKEEKNREAFEEWYLHEYGHPYQWRTKKYESGILAVLR